MGEFDDQKAKLHQIANNVRSLCGKESVITFENGIWDPVEAISTGSVAFDQALGVGGFPRGRIVELFGSEGAGKCVEKGTYIQSINNGLVPIGSLDARDEKSEGFVELCVEVGTEEGRENTSHLYRGGEQDTIKVVTRCGYAIEGTKTHRIRIMSPAGEIVWKALQDISEGDFCIIKRGGDFGKGVDLSGFRFTPTKMASNTKDCAIPLQMTPSLARILGYLVAEGTVTYKGGFLFTNYDMVIVEDYRRCIEEVFNLSFTNGSSIKRGWQIASVKARKFLEYCGLDYMRSNRKEVPWSIMQASHECVVEFLRAYWEGDGGMWTPNSIGCTSASEKLIDQIQQLLLILGIISRKKTIHCRATNTVDKIYRDYYNLAISGSPMRLFKELVGFISTEKQAGLEIASTGKVNSNMGNIPFMQQSLRQFMKVIITACSTTGGGHQFKGQGCKAVLGQSLRDGVNDVVSGWCMLSYEKLSQLLSKATVVAETTIYKKLKALRDLNYFYDAVVMLTSGKSEVYDVTVPGSHSYVSNGFISHNSSIALSTIAQAQRQGLICAFIDAENSFSPEWAGLLGIDMTFLLFSQESCLETVFTLADHFIDQGVNVIVIDSIASLAPKAELEGEIGDVHVALVARQMTQVLRRFASKLNKTNTLAIFINQIRMQVGVMFGNPETTPGGRALKFYASIRLDVRGSTRIKKGEEIEGMQINATVVKNKVAPPFKKASADFYFNRGFDNELSYADLAIDKGIFRKNGAYYEFGEINKTRANWSILFKEDPAILKQVVEAVANAGA